MLYINKVLVDDLIAVAESMDEECCGFLFGHDRFEERIVTETMVAQNVAENRKDRFEISPKEYLDAENYADKNKLTLVGFYHSHLDYPAIPSESDRLGAYPDLSYVIVAVTNRKFKDIRSWRLSSLGRFEEEVIDNRTKN